MKEKDLTKGKVTAVITALALPIMGSSFLQFTYNLIDMVWVGKLGSSAVASIGSSTLYINIGNAINSLVVTGTGIKAANAVGRKNSDEVNEYINSGIILNTIIGILFGLTLVFLGNKLIGFLNLNNFEVERDAYHYLTLNAPILFFAFFNMLYTRILGSFGNNKLAFRINTIGVILNLILDPLCIYGFKFGVIGAGISTLIANIIMFALFRIYSNGILKYKTKIKVHFIRIKEIMTLGFPMAFQRIIFTIINIILAKIIAVFGADAIAAQKIGLQIESVAYMIIGGFSSAVSSFTGQNFGAGKFKRIKEGYKSALKIGIIYSVFITGVFLLFNRPIIRLFVKDETTISIAVSYLNVVAFSQVFSAVEMISNGLFTGIAMPNIPSGISIVFTALRIPLALLFIKRFGISGIWMSISLSSILKGSFSYLFVKIIYKKEYLQEAA